MGRDWKGRIILNYFKIKQDETVMIANGLIPHLEFKYGDNVRDFLTQMRFWRRRIGFGTMRGKR